MADHRLNLLGFLDLSAFGDRYAASGNVGMLGAGYAGYFEPGDAAGLADALLRCRAEQVAQAKQVAPAGPVDQPAHPSPATAPPPLLAQLQAQCAARAPVFSPENERLSLRM